MKRIRPFDSRQLQAFDMLCSTGSFTETAKRLFLTQSAVSHSMKSLEDECGSRLFRRQGKKVSLTEAGDRLLRFTRPFLVEMEKVREELDGFEKFESAGSVWGQALKPAGFSFRLCCLSSKRTSALPFRGEVRGHAPLPGNAWVGRD